MAGDLMKGESMRILNEENTRPTMIFYSIFGIPFFHWDGKRLHFDLFRKRLPEGRLLPNDFQLTVTGKDGCCFLHFQREKEIFEYPLEPGEKFFCDLVSSDGFSNCVSAWNLSVSYLLNEERSRLLKVTLPPHGKTMNSDCIRVIYDSRKRKKPLSAFLSEKELEKLPPGNNRMLNNKYTDIEILSLLDVSPDGSELLVCGYKRNIRLQDDGSVVFYGKPETMLYDVGGNSLAPVYSRRREKEKNDC